jgi:CMP-2-keto-3-deoxyoctulosonic acid synthetase
VSPSHITLSQNQKIISEQIERKEEISSVQSKIIDTVKKLSPSVVSIVISKNLEILYYNDPFSLQPYIEKRKKKI